MVIQNLRIGRVWWIPRAVARMAMLSTGDKPVVGTAVYVGPLANVGGVLWRLMGYETEAC